MKQVLRVDWVAPPGNKFQRLHGQQQTKIAREAYHTITVECLRQGIVPLEEEHYPIRLTLAVYFGKGVRSYDWVNLWPTAKIIEDGLRKARIKGRPVLAEDSRKFVEYGTMIPRIDRSSPFSYSILTITSNTL